MNERAPTLPTPAEQSGHKPGSVLVLGEALVDLFESGPVAGGAPFNVARSLAALQVATQFITRVGQGDLWSELLVSSAQDYGLPTQGFQRDSSHPTGTVQVVQKGAAHTFRIAEDAAWDYLDVTQAMQTLAATAQPTFVYFGTLAQRHIVSRQSMREAIRTAGGVRYLDLNLRDGPDNRRLAEESLELAHWVKVNDEELMELLAWQGGAGVRSAQWGSAKLHEGVARLIEHFALQRLIVTRGPLGYASFDATGRCEVEGGGIEIPSLVDTVGAGDGFSAMLLACQVVGHSLPWSLALANEYAAAICTHRGPLRADPSSYAAWRKRLAGHTTSNALHTA